MFWVGTGCCGCLTLLLLVIIIGGGSCVYMTKAPVDAVTMELAEIKAGQIDAAYARLSPSYQAVLSRSDFDQLIATHETLRDNASSSFWKKRSIVNNTAELEGSVTSAGNVSEAVAFNLIKEDGAWKIAGIHFAGDDISVPGATPTPQP
jgi:hypothetical protein